MSLIEVYLKQKLALEEAIKELYGLMINTDITTEGSFKIKLYSLEKQLKEMNLKISGEVQQQAPVALESTQGVRILKLFLASSFELKSEREQFEIFINRENNNLIQQKIFIRLVIWEDFLDSVSETRLQDRYNEEVAASDIFVSLFYSKTGKYTKEEFELALKTFRDNGRPHVYTYFKDLIGEQKGTEADSLIEFKRYLSSIGHFPTSFSDIFDLKYQFKMQLEKIIPKLKLI